MRALFVDDSPRRREEFSKYFPPADVRYASTCEDAILALENERFDFCFLDYDLEHQETTEEIASHIRTMASERMIVLIHSNDPAGARRLQNILPRARYCPFEDLISIVRFSKQRP